MAAVQGSIAAVEAAFKASNIAEDLHFTFKPVAVLEMSFPQPDGSEVKVEAGAQLPRDATVGPPKYALKGDFNPQDTFVLISVDPDGPTPQEPTYSPIRHFLGSDFVVKGDALVSETAPVSKWLQPSPPAYSDPHRYLVLAYRQPPGFNDQKLVDTTTSWAKWDMNAFAKATNLGEPIAGNFFIVSTKPAN